MALSAGVKTVDYVKAASTEYGLSYFEGLKRAYDEDFPKFTGA